LTKFKVFLRSTLDNYTDFEDINFPVETNIYECGRHEFPDYCVGLMNLTIVDSLFKPSTAYFQLLSDEQEIMMLEPYWTTHPYIDFPLGEPDHDLDFPDEGTYVYVQVDDSGSSDDNPYGTFTITGTRHGDEGDEEEEIEINGYGCYRSAYKYDSLSQADVGAGLKANFSVWVLQKDAEDVAREIFIYGDVNEDGVYGLMFAGWCRLQSVSNDRTFDILNYSCVDYGGLFEISEYIAGYRARYRCSYFKEYWTYGACNKASPNFRAPGKCFVGDYDTRHPTGELCDSDYRCLDYVPDYSRPLPYDGFSYDDNYAPSDHDSYQPYPYDYFRCLMALRDMANSLEIDVNVSRPYGLRELDADITLSSDCTSEDTSIDINNPNGFNATDVYVMIRTQDEGDDIYEFIFGTIFDTYIDVAPDGRGVLNTKNISHKSGDKVWVFELADSPYTSNDNLMIEMNIESTLYDTLESIAKLVDRTNDDADEMTVGFVDFMKNINLIKLYGNDYSHGEDPITFEEEDIYEVSNIERYGIVNHYYGWVEISNDEYLFYEARDEESIRKYGLHSEEVDSPQLNSLTNNIGDGRFGIKDYIDRKLAYTKYPRVRQTIFVGEFIPDEHYWTHGYQPLLDYTDKPNKFICLLGAYIKCPDFSLIDRPLVGFQIEEIHYKVVDDVRLETRLVVSRRQGEVESGNGGGNGE